MAITDYEVVIGLEVHCQLKTATKMFSACAYAVGAEPNTQVDAYTLGLPGTLPVPNRQAVDYALRLALALRCEIQPVSRWARKHYFYPDLPKGYQITQNDAPYALGGFVEIPDPAGQGELASKQIRLQRIHMEEDAGKNTHLLGEDESLVDYNRAGAPLVEIVSRPDIRSAAEAADYLRELRTIVRYLDISDANMEEGTLRCDANVSLRRKGVEALGTRCEIKNLNSFKFLELAIEAEIRRQADLLDQGRAVVQSTLSYDTARDITRVMRTKEEAADYRYFPEPDMPPLLISDEWIARVREILPELPWALRRRYVELGLTAYDAGVLTADPALARFFSAALVAGPGLPAKQIGNWLKDELLGLLNADDRSIVESPITPEGLAEIVELVETDVISRRAAKEVFEKAYREGQTPKVIVERDGYRQVSDTGAIEALVREVIAANPGQLEQLLGGKDKVRGFFVGQVMKRSKGQANPGVVNEVLERVIAGIRAERGG
ncbi:MAG: Asp-tRNA(Asn)/Glu-tRNA(Gln) amidotransferase subunit GatB [Deltaproteobacteria bacterium]|nr:Asp-tRNA(Asn)/Glu-tRNA(Gln) amidotransferase subunit GatB [Deltaproteobacteria bacterium]